MDRRISKDRRRRLAAALSWFTFSGRPRPIQRDEDHRTSLSADRHGSVVFFFLVLILGLNILDSLFTMMILDLRGREANPIVRTAIDLYGSNFWIWKFSIVSLCAILLCMHSKRPVVKGVIIALCCVYITVVHYQIFLLRNFYF